MAVNFETVAEEGSRKARILLFGLCDPEHGDVYRNEMELYLTLDDETSFVAKVDLTEDLSDIMDKNGGVISGDITIPIEVKKTPIGVGAEVGGWIEEGESEKET
jgi:hypothetical protein